MTILESKLQNAKRGLGRLNFFGQDVEVLVLFTSLRLLVGTNVTFLFDKSIPFSF